MGKNRSIPAFSQTLISNGISLNRSQAETLQVNVGMLCDQHCRHCHLSAGPDRKEIMTRETMEAVISHAEKFAYPIIDITGGAPEMNPDIEFFLKGIAHLADRVMLRSNLTAITSRKGESLLTLIRESGISLVASFPSLNEAQTASQRGDTVFRRSVDTLKKLNQIGYGIPGSGLELDLVSNPVGAFLPGSQESVEKRFKRELKEKYDIDFNRLYVFSNVPLGRYKDWLIASGNFDNYMEKLVLAFNPCAAGGLMCRTLVSVGWDGFLYDCDFNLAAGLFMGRKKIHISELEGYPPVGSPIAVSDCCYSCTAGSGFT